MDSSREHEQAPFNMAIDTLKRLGEILREIKIASTNPNITKDLRQEIKINLTKQFFIQATPLLDEKYVKDNKDKVLAINPILIKVGERYSSGKVQVKGYQVNYNNELEIFLDTLLVELQCQLQQRGHFMPDADESSLF